MSVILPTSEVAADLRDRRSVPASTLRTAAKMLVCSRKFASDDSSSSSFDSKDAPLTRNTLEALATAVAKAQTRARNQILDCACS
jgi:hypothetical protein